MSQNGPLSQFIQRNLPGAAKPKKAAPPRMTPTVADYLLGRAQVPQPPAQNPNPIADQQRQNAQALRRMLPGIDRVANPSNERRVQIRANTPGTPENTRELVRRRLAALPIPDDKRAEVEALVDSALFIRTTYLDPETGLRRKVSPLAPQNAIRQTGLLDPSDAMEVVELLKTEQGIRLLKTEVEQFRAQRRRGRARARELEALARPGNVDPNIAGVGGVLDALKPVALGLPSELMSRAIQNDPANIAGAVGAGEAVVGAFQDAGLAPLRVGLEPLRMLGVDPEAIERGIRQFGQAQVRGFAGGVSSMTRIPQLLGSREWADLSDAIDKGIAMREADKPLDKTFFNEIGQTIGGVIPQIAPALLTGGSSIGASVAGRMAASAVFGVTEAATNAAGGFDRAVKEGQNIEEARQRAFRAMPVDAIVSSALNRFGEFSDLSPAWKKMFASSFTEGLQETFQTGLEGYVATGELDFTSPEAIKGGLLGMILGPLMSGGIDLATGTQMEGGAEAVPQRSAAASVPPVAPPVAPVTEAEPQMNAGALAMNTPQGALPDSPRTAPADMPRQQEAPQAQAPAETQPQPVSQQPSAPTATQRGDLQSRRQQYLDTLETDDQRQAATRHYEKVDAARAAVPAPVLKWLDGATPEQQTVFTLSKSRAETLVKVKMTPEEYRDAKYYVEIMASEVDPRGRKRFLPMNEADVPVPTGRTVSNGKRNMVTQPDANGNEWWTDSHMATRGIPKGVLPPAEQEQKPEIQRVIPKEFGERVTPSAFVRDQDLPRSEAELVVILSNGARVNANRWRFLQKNVPGIAYYTQENPERVIVAHDADGNPIALLMPMQFDEEAAKLATQPQPVASGASASPEYAAYVREMDSKPTLYSDPVSAKGMDEFANHPDRLNPNVYLRRKREWEVTRATWQGLQPPAYRESVGNAHMREVARALREGIPVPPEVLADYPELLAPQPKQSATKPRAKAKKEAQPQQRTEPTQMPTREQQAAMNAQPPANVPDVPSLRKVAEGVGRPAQAEIPPQPATTPKPELAPDTARMQAQKQEATKARQSSREESARRKSAEGFAALPERSRAEFDKRMASNSVDDIASMLHPSNKSFRAEFERRTGVTLPSTVSGTKQAVANWVQARSQNTPAKAPESVSPGVQPTQEPSAPSAVQGGQVLPVDAIAGMVARGDEWGALAEIERHIEAFTGVDSRDPLVNLLASQVLREFDQFPSTTPVANRLPEAVLGNFRRMVEAFPDVKDREPGTPAYEALSGNPAFTGMSVDELKDALAKRRQQEVARKNQEQQAAIASQARSLASYAPDLPPQYVKDIALRVANGEVTREEAVATLRQAQSEEKARIKERQFDEGVASNKPAAWTRGINKKQARLSEDGRFWTDTHVLIAIPKGAKLPASMAPTNDPMPNEQIARVWDGNSTATDAPVLTRLGQVPGEADVYDIAGESIAIDRNRVALVEKFHGPLTLRGHSPRKAITAYNAKGNKVALIMPMQVDDSYLQMARAKYQPPAPTGPAIDPATPAQFAQVNQGRAGVPNFPASAEGIVPQQAQAQPAQPSRLGQVLAESQLPAPRTEARTEKAPESVSPGAQQAEGSTAGVAAEPTAQKQAAQEQTVYRYAPRLRPPSPGAVPREGLIGTTRGGEWGVAEYSRELTPQEIRDYELDVLPPRREAIKEAPRAMTMEEREAVTIQGPRPDYADVASLPEGKRFVFDPTTQFVYDADLLRDAAAAKLGLRANNVRFGASLNTPNSYVEKYGYGRAADQAYAVDLNSGKGTPAYQSEEAHALLLDEIRRGQERVTAHAKKAESDQAAREAEWAKEAKPRTRAQQRADAKKRDAALQVLVYGTPGTVIEKRGYTDTVVSYDKKQGTVVVSRTEDGRNMGQFTLMGGLDKRDVVSITAPDGTVLYGNRKLTDAAKERVEAMLAPKQAKKPQAPAPAPAETASKIEDVGEKVGGARKDLAATREAGKKERKKGEARFVIVPPDARSSKFTVVDRQARFNSIIGEASTQAKAETIVKIGIFSQRHGFSNTADRGYVIYRKVGERRVVLKSGFESKEAAQQYAVKNIDEVLGIKTSFGESDLVTTARVTRTGPKRRSGNVTAKQLKDTFGLRAVEFGNWNNQSERQAVVNEAYDALADLASLMGVDPAFVGLGGNLSLAFGARGRGLSSSRAHFEPERVVINLTKENGFGALAHEWFHAFDQYLLHHKNYPWQGDVVSGVRPGVANFASEAVSGGAKTLPQEVLDAIKGLRQTIKVKTVSDPEAQKRAKAAIESRKNELVAKAEDVKRFILTPGYSERKGGSKITDADRARLDEIVALISTGAHPVERQALQSNSSSPLRAMTVSKAVYTNDLIDELSELSKKATGQKQLYADNQGVIGGLGSAQRSYDLAIERERTTTADATRETPTEFLKNAREIDRGRTTSYWSEPRELFARAFQAYVADRSGESNSYLDYGSRNEFYKAKYLPWADDQARPYPEGEERTQIVNAVERLIQAVAAAQPRQAPDILASPSRVRRGVPPQPVVVNKGNVSAKTQGPTGATPIAWKIVPIPHNGPTIHLDQLTELGVKAFGQGIVGTSATGTKGAFVLTSGTLYVKKSNDHITYAHEGAHRLDQKYKITDALIGSPAHAELDSGHFDHSVPQNASAAVKLKEQFAAFMEAYVSDPSTLNTVAPNMVKAFEASVPKETVDAIRKFSEGLRRYAGQAPEAKVKGSFLAPTTPKTFTQMVADNVQGLVTDENLDAAAREVFDEYAPFIRTVDRMVGGGDMDAGRAKRKGERGITDNPNDFEVALREVPYTEQMLEDAVRKGMLNRLVSAKTGKTTRTTKSLLAILEPFGVRGKDQDVFMENWRDFEAYIASMRHLDFARRQAKIAAENIQNYKAVLATRLTQKKAAYTMKADSDLQAELLRIARDPSLTPAQRKAKERVLVDARNARVKLGHKRLEAGAKGALTTYTKHQQAEAKRRGEQSGIAVPYGVPGVDSTIRVAGETIKRLQQDKAKWARLKQAEKDLREFSFTMIDNLEWAGILSPEQAQSIKDNNPYWFAIQRVEDPVTEPTITDLLRYGQSGLQAKNPIHALVGSSKSKQDVISALVGRVALTIDSAARNRVAQVTANWLNANGLPDGTDGEIIRVRKSDGIDATTPNTFKFYDHGQEVVWQVHPKNAALIDSLNRVGSLQSDKLDRMLWNVVSSASTMTHRFIVSAPPFIARNLFRDTFHRVSMVGGNLLDTFLPKDKRGKEFKDAFGMGLGRSTVLTNRETYERNQRKVMKELAQRGNVIYHIGRGYHALQAKAEEANRLVVYKDAYKKFRAMGRTEYEADLLAFYAAREGMVDFKKAGVTARKVSRFIPFFNAAIAGQRTTGTQLRNNPGKVAVRMMEIAVIGIALEQAFAAMGGEEEEKRLAGLSPYQREMFWNFRIGGDDGFWLSIPKGHEQAVGISMVERMHELARGREVEAKRSVTTLRDNTLPISRFEDVLGGWKALFEIGFNRALYNMKTIVPDHERGLAMGARKGTQYASPVGQGMAGVFRFGDPRQWDHAIENMTGYYGRIVTELSEAKTLDEHIRASSRLTGLTMPGSPTQNENVIAVDNLLSSIGVRPPGWDALKDSFYDAPDEASRQRAARRLIDTAEKWRERLEPMMERNPNVRKEIAKQYLEAVGGYN